MDVEQALLAAYMAERRITCRCYRSDCVHCACVVLAAEVKKLRASRTRRPLHCRHCGLDLIDGICGVCDR